MDDNANAGTPLALLTTEEMGRADQMTVEGGRPGAELMERAGGHVAAALERAPKKGRLAVLCGPGNNGGDGFVAARLAREAGWEVRLGLLGDPEKLSGDAAAMARAWTGKIEAASPELADGAACVIDALFGAGLSRPLEGRAAALAEAVNASNAFVIAVDVPSGLDGDTGLIRGTAVRADVTVTFFRAKPGHLLMPGRMLCGEVIVGDIGIEPDVLETIRPDCFRNLPALWAEQFPVPHPDGHKYARGHVLALTGGPWATGAGRLAAAGALRAGAGLVTVGSPGNALAVNAAHLTAIMLAPCDSAEDLSRLLAERKRNAVVMGPGLGVEERTRDLVEAALAADATAVLDADAVTVGAQYRDHFIRALHGRAILTPHEGEFARLFPDALVQGRLAAARAAARETGAVLLLKGPDTVVAAPNGRAAIAANAPPDLATAGAGDVLAGMIAGLAAQGMPPFEAACTGVWLHGEAAAAFGPGLTADDLPDRLPGVLADVRSRLRLGIEAVL